MQTIVGPVVVTKEGGFGFDLWTSEEGLSPGFSYRCIEDAYHARKFEIRSRTQCLAGAMTACSTLDEFASALARRWFYFCLGARAAPFTSTYWPTPARPRTRPIG